MSTNKIGIMLEASETATHRKRNSELNHIDIILKQTTYDSNKNAISAEVFCRN